MADQYGAVERRIARVLSEFPLLKGLVKQAYARLTYHLKGGRQADVSTRVPIRPVGPEGVETFFGYYDKSPLSVDGWLLCHAAEHTSTVRPSADKQVAIQVYDFSAKEFVRPVMSANTACYNWQQGARAHWLDGDHFIFNDFDEAEQQYISRVHSVSTRGEVRRYPLPVQDSWKREFFLSINYRRLQALRPDYGYCPLGTLPEAELNRLDNDGIWYVDQESAGHRLLYSLHDICQVDKQTDFESARHKVNHVMIGPDGRQFIFLHRYFIGKRKFDRLMLAQTDGSSLRVLCAHDMVSHCFWVDPETVLAYLRGPSGKDGYYTVHIASGKIESLFGGTLDGLGDGHPHVHGDWFVTDTYPDRRRMQHLLRANFRTGAVEPLASFHQSFRYGGETRCDLHPRISADGRYVFVDSVCDGHRQLYFLELDPQEEA